MASNSEKYFSRSWALLTRDKGWFKPVILLALAHLVPIVGPLGVYGYILEWARLTAWGVDSAPKQKGVNIGECISSGWRGFVAVLGWGIIYYIIAGILSAISLFGLLNLAVFVAGIFVNAILSVCALRATIYQKIGAGYQANRIFEMVKSDFAGIARISGLNVVINLIIGAFVCIISMIMMLPAFTQIAALAATTSGTTRSLTAAQAAQVLGIIGSLAVPFCIILIVVLVLATISNLVITTAVGLWMRNFDVPSWGDSADEVPGVSAAAATTSVQPPAVPAETAASETAAPVAVPVPSADEKSEQTTIVEEVSLTEPASESEPASTSDASVENMQDVENSAPAEAQPEASVAEEAVTPAESDETAGEEKSE
ncbi:DUF4013 domain-containing protein [Olsenella intestinalis]|uniref:DUF4013 domain-containing protein n=1 Tax=Olsenella intestinalis TaxID=2930083 RepID=UPI00200BE8FE|nr:DUF4013 domain-containing protein [Olsenella intestinalis]